MVRKPKIAPLAAVKAEIATHCAHCGAPIIDPTTQVVHGQNAYCCPNCAAAMEQHGAGASPHPRGDAHDFVCAHCRVPIVDESTMQSRGDLAFCCANCAAVGAAQPAR